MIHEIFSFFLFVLFFEKLMNKRNLPVEEMQWKFVQCSVRFMFMKPTKNLNFPSQFSLLEKQTKKMNRQKKKVTVVAPAAGPPRTAFK